MTASEKIIGIVFLILASCANDSAFNVKNSVISEDIKSINTPVNDGNIFIFAMGGGEVGTNYVKFEQTMMAFDKTMNNYLYNGVYRLFGGGENSSIFDVLVLKDRGAGIYDSTDLEHPQIFDLLHYQRIEGETRHNYLDNVTDFTFDNLINQLNDLITKVKSNDKVRFFWIGNGTKEGHLQLRNGDFRINELAEKLDELDKDTQIQLLISQGHGKNFSMLNYTNGYFEKGLTDHYRCAFFDYDESDYILSKSKNTYDLRDIWNRKVYVDYFFESYDSKKLDADYNSDGIVGANEAHAFALANINNYGNYRGDLTTSEALLSSFYRDKTNNILDLISGENFTWMNFLQKLDPAEKALFLAMKNKLEGTIIIDSDIEMVDILKVLEDAKAKVYENYNSSFKIETGPFNNLLKDSVNIIFKDISNITARGRMSALTTLDPVAVTVSGDIEIKRDEMIKITQDYFEKHEKFDLLKNQLITLSKMSADIDKLTEDYTDTFGLIEVFRNQVIRKLRELYLIKIDQQNPVYQKYMQLKACEAASFF